MSQETTGIDRGGTEGGTPATVSSLRSELELIDARLRDLEARLGNLNPDQRAPTEPAAEEVVPVAKAVRSHNEVWQAKRFASLYLKRARGRFRRS
jgi:hypothetical protein